MRLRSVLRSLSRHPECARRIVQRLTPEEWDQHRRTTGWLCGRDDQLPPLADAQGRQALAHLAPARRPRLRQDARRRRMGARPGAPSSPHLADRRSHRIALVGDTIGQVRSVMIEGLSGLLSIHLAGRAPDARGLAATSWSGPTARSPRCSPPTIPTACAGPSSTPPGATSCASGAGPTTPGTRCSSRCAWARCRSASSPPRRGRSRS